MVIIYHPRDGGGGKEWGGEGVGIFLLCYNEIYLTSPPFPLGSLVFNDPLHYSQFPIVPPLYYVNND